MSELVISNLVAKVSLISSSAPYSKECMLNANNDLQAIREWLNQYMHKDTTYKTYKRESDRLILWCTYEAGKKLGELNTADLTSYIFFLANPPDRWCTTVANIRNSGHGGSKWRPFLGPLSDSAKRTAIRVINSLFNYLVDSFYLKANPLKLIKQYNKFNIKSDEYKYQVWSKILDDNEWLALQQALQNMPDNTSLEIDNKIRMQFIIACLYLLGLRVSELANSTWNNFKFHQGSWWFFVRGKGDKLGHIPVNEQLLLIIKKYRVYLKKTEFPQENDTDNLIMSKKTSRALSIKQIYSIIKNLGQIAAKQFSAESISFKKLCAMSPHTLRHLSASHQERAGISMNMIQANLRHSSLHTTKIYMHTDDVARSSAMDKIKLTIPITIPQSENKVDLSIQISGNNVCGEYSLKQLLQIIEGKILQCFTWSSSCNDHDALISEYQRVSIVGGFVIIKYSIACTLEDAERIKSAISREADIRLFKITFK